MESSVYIRDANLFFFMIIYRKLLLFFVLAFTTGQLIGQGRKTDSLLQVLSRYEAANKSRQPDLRDSIKIDILEKLVVQYVDSDPNTALGYSREILDFSKKIGFQEGIGYGHLSIGGLYNRLGIHEKAIAELKTAAVMFVKAKDESSLSKAYAELGIVFSKLGNFPEAMYYNLASLKIVERQDDVFAIASSQINIGILYKQHGDYDKAMQYYNAALETTKKLKTEDANYVQGYAYNSIGQTYLKQNRVDQALDMLKRAQEKARPFNDAFQDSDILLSIGNAYLAKGDPVKAIENFKQSLELCIKNDLQTGISECSLQMGRAHFKLGEIAEALAYTNKALNIAKKIDQKEFVRDAYGNLSEIYAATQNYKAAYANQVLFKQVNDSLFNEEKNKKLTEQQMTYEFNKKQAAAKDIQQKKDVRMQAAAKRERAVNITALVALLLVSGFAFSINRSLRRNQRQKRLIEQQNAVIQQSLTEKETLLREIHHRVKNNLQIISSLLNIQSEDISDANVLSSIQEGQSRVEAMSLIHQNLYQSEHLNNVDIENYMRELVQYLAKMFRGESDLVDVTIETSDIRFDIDTAIPLGLIVNELVSNAYKYAFDANQKGKIAINIIAKSDSDYQLNITNDGKPLPPDFDPKKSKSLGLKLVSILSRQLRGSFSSVSENGITSFTVDFKDMKAWQAAN
jgi:two-component sensor histidine kinase